MPADQTSVKGNATHVNLPANERTTGPYRIGRSLSNQVRASAKVGSSLACWMSLLNDDMNAPPGLKFRSGNRIQQGRCVEVIPRHPLAGIARQVPAFLSSSVRQKGAIDAEASQFADNDL